VDVASSALFLSGAKIAIQRQPFALLAVLLEKPGEVVTREELRARLWPDGTVVDFELALNTTVRKLRRALGDSAGRPRFVETVPLRGYRFVAPVEDAADDGSRGDASAIPAALVAAPIDDPIDDRRHRSIADTAAANGGDAITWRDGALMARFASGSDAVRAGIALQANGRTGMRIAVASASGSGVGDEAPFEAARELAARAAAGGIVCDRDVARALAGCADFSLRALGGRDADAAEAYEVRGSDETPLGPPPFVGRDAELVRLAALLARAEGGRGGLAFVAGEPGIGKTRLLDEFATRARAMGAQVLVGVARDGELGRPFGPFAEGLGAWVRETDADVLRATLGRHASILARIVPELHDRIDDLAAPEPLSPDEDRARLLDAIAQSLWQLAQRKPLVLLLDDLHWADGATLALLRHVARFVARRRVLVVGAYRDVELDRRHALHDALAALGNDVPVERIDLHGLSGADVAELLAGLMPETVSPAFLGAIERETQGNPFFVREVVLHLMEEGRLAASIGARGAIELGVPDSVRQVIGRRLARLSQTANRLLVAAAACDGAFRFAIAAAASDLAEDVALDALDEALEAQLVRGTSDPEVYEFVHALIRHVLDDSISQARRSRLHRRLAELIQAQTGADDADALFEIARHYALSAALPGAERGADAALAAADGADRALAFERSVAALRIAEELLPADDARRPRVRARFALALARAGAHEDAFVAAREATRMIAASEGGDAAADYLADAAPHLVATVGQGTPRVWLLAREALGYIGPRRDATWAYLTLHDIDHRESAENGEIGVMLDYPERREAWEILDRTWRGARGSERELSLVQFNDTWRHFESRREILRDWSDSPTALGFWTGEFRRAIELIDEQIAEALRRGRLVLVAAYLVPRARLHASLGEFAAADRSLEESAEYYERVALSHLRLPFVPIELAWYRGNVGAGIAPAIEAFLAQDRPEHRYGFAAFRTAAALAHAITGNRAAAQQIIARVAPSADRSLLGDVGCTGFLCHAARVLWELGWPEHADIFERNVRAKPLAADFRFPAVDARLALAQLAALTGRHDEAHAWFERARTVLDEQGARPLRAIVDFDEAWALQRRAARGGRDRGRALLDAACAQFESIGMPGWLRRADALARELG
jgi:DNA-binding winged helix-turn-helix (wHTH) protein